METNNTEKGPNSFYGLFIKFISSKYIDSMVNDDLLYMNTVEYFRKIENEEIVVRSDRDEGTAAIFDPSKLIVEVDDWIQNHDKMVAADSIAQENERREREKNRQQLMALAEADIKNTDYVGAINIYRQIQDGVSKGLYFDFQMDSLLKDPQQITSKIEKCKLAFRQKNASKILKVDSINSEWSLVVQSFDSVVVANKLFLISGVVMVCCFSSAFAPASVRNSNVNSR
jgi:hypothetical protein